MKTKIMLLSALVFIFSIGSYRSYAEYYVVASAPTPCCTTLYTSPHYRHRVHHRYHRVYHRPSRCLVEVYYPYVCTPICGGCGRWVLGAPVKTYYAEPSRYDSPGYYKDPQVDIQFNHEFNQDMATGDDDMMSHPDVNNQY